MNTAYTFIWLKTNDKDVQKTFRFKKWFSLVNHFIHLCSIYKLTQMYGGPFNELINLIKFLFMVRSSPTIFYSHILT